MKNIILIVTPEIPYPPKNGWNVRHYQLIRALSSSLVCDVVSLTKDNRLCNTAVEDVNRKNLKVRQFKAVASWRRSKLLCAILSLITRRPLGSVLYDSKKLRRILKLKTSLERYDSCLILGGICMPQYARYICANQMVWDMCDDTVLLFLRRTAVARGLVKASFYKGQAKLNGKYLRKASKMFDTILVINEKDAYPLRSSFAKQIVTIPIIVDLDQFYPNQQSITENITELLFTGAMSTWANRDAVNFFVDKVLPLVDRDCAKVKFHVVGTGSDSLNFENHSNVVLTGFVPDLRLYYNSCAVFVCHLRTGAGVKVKMLEAMACGCAIVSTPIGVEGLRVCDGRELLIVQDAAGFARAVKSLLNDPNLRQQLGINARHFVEQEFSSEERDDRLLNALISQRR